MGRQNRGESIRRAWLGLWFHTLARAHLLPRFWGDVHGGSLLPRPGDPVRHEPKRQERFVHTGRQAQTNAGLHAQVLAKANKERLRVLLEEARDNKGDQTRYQAALNGESLGTHTTGTTVEAKAVK